MTNRRPEGGRQVSALLNEAAWLVFAREGSDRRGGKFLSKAILYWEHNGPHVKDGMWMMNDAMRKEIRHLQSVIRRYIDQQQESWKPIENLEAKLGAFGGTQEDTKTDEDC